MPTRRRKPSELQIPLLTDIVERGELGEDDELDELTQPRRVHSISRAEINLLVQSTLARYLVMASKEISEKIERKLNESEE